MKSLILFVMLIGFSAVALACPDTDPACSDGPNAGIIIRKGVRPIIYTQQICTASWG